jgi:Fe-S oxidoreductase/FAD/FMN-containing dehydrogenase
MTKRVSFEVLERLLYSNDLSSPPNLVKNGIDALPSSIVQPKAKEELAELFKYAKENYYKITPRGSGTGGTGGAVPTESGIVVDFARMNNILEIDDKELTATVEPGVVWWDLEKELNKKGLSLRLYPTSALSSTVAGWVAEQGGIGVGSLEYGSLKNSLVDVEVILPDGTTKNMSGEDLDLVVECQGITGFITRVKLKVKKFEKIIPILAHFPDVKKLHHALFAAKELPIWNISFSTPNYSKLKHKAEGVATKKKESYSAMFAILESRLAEIGDKLDIIIKDQNGTKQHKKLAEKEWEDRFFPMRIKSLGPSMIAGEVFVPVDILSGFIQEANLRITDKYFVMEGMLASKEMTSVLAFSLDFEERTGYSMAWKMSLDLVRIAKRMQGKTQRIGMYLTSEAEEYFGKERYERIKEFKSKVDPNNLMNPNKILTSPSIRILLPPVVSLSTLMQYGHPMMALGKRLLPYKGNEKAKKKLEKVSNFSWDLYKCASCGFCNSVCPVFKEKRWESSAPRGKLSQLKFFTNEHPHLGNGWVDNIYCTLCAKCETVCQVDIKFHEVWEEIRAWMVKNDYGPPANAKTMYNAIFDPRFQNPFQEPKAGRTEWYKDEYTLPKTASTVYFAGCMTSYHEYKILLSYLKIFTKAGLDFTMLGEEEKCCGAINLFTGQPDGFEKLAKYNIGQVKRRGAHSIVTGCPGCYRALHKYKKIVDYDFEVYHSSEVVAKLIHDGKLELTKEFKSKKNPVIYHDPCELGRIPEMELGRGIYEEPRFILEQVPGLELLEFDNNKKDADCCGGGGGLKAVDYDVTTKIAGRRIDAGLETGATTIAAMCNNCKNQMYPVAKDMKKEFKAAGKKRDINVTDIAEIIAASI